MGQYLLKRISCLLFKQSLDFVKEESFPTVLVGSAGQNKLVKPSIDSKLGDLCKMTFQLEIFSTHILYSSKRDLLMNFWSKELGRKC